jgi:hypothetical protein
MKEKNKKKTKQKNQTKKNPIMEGPTNKIEQITIISFIYNNKPSKK